jgi:hypothetical protein
MSLLVLCPLRRHAARRWGASADACLLVVRQFDPTLAANPSVFSPRWKKTMEMSSISPSCEMGHSEKAQPSTIGDRSFHWLPSIPVKHVAFATGEDGFHEVKRRSRSLLHHPLGLPLACLLNEAMSPEVESITNQIVGDNALSTEFNKIIDSLSPVIADIQEMVESWVLSSDHNEAYVRRSLANKMSGLLRACEPTTSPNSRMFFGKDKYGRIEILIQRHDANSGDPTVLLIEAGFRNEDWWLKVDQSLIRIKGLGKAFSEPLLLAVLTVSNDEELNKLHARLGVFLVTPKENKAGDFRLSLLWQHRCCNLIDLASGFERITRAMVFLAKWNENFKGKKLNHEYLSPHCCRIGDRVSHVACKVSRSGKIPSPILLRCIGPSKLR